MAQFMNFVHSDVENVDASLGPSAFLRGVLAQAKSRACLINSTWLCRPFSDFELHGAAPHFGARQNLDAGKILRGMLKAIGLRA
jgi:hypothetical protein